MIDDETLESAKRWCELGSQWIDKKAYPTGTQYLDRALAVFEEKEDLTWLTYTRHQKLNALRVMGKDEEAESLSEDVLDGYLKLDDAYGKALALSHAAESTARLGRRERAMSRLNLASAVTQGEKLRDLQAFILNQRARLYRENGNMVLAVRLYREAEKLLHDQKRLDDAARNRFAAAEALIELDEISEAAALLEDVQTHFFRGERYREALQSLTLLSRLYEQSAMWDDKNRIAEMIHFCGQYILQGAKEQAAPEGPEIPRAER